MAIKQISTFVENKTGSLVECTKVLTEAGIDMRAMSIADTRDFGILRMIVSDTYGAACALKEANFVVSTTDVVGAIINDEPGGLAKLIAELAESEISIKYMYAFVGKSNAHAYVVIRVDDTKACEKILREKGITVLTEDDVKNM